MIEIPNFTIERELGRGGMATVYLAMQDILNRHVALKVMLPDMARDENFRKSFLSEGKIIANLEHTNIVRIHNFGIIDDSILYMAMEYLSDGTLKDKLAQGKLPYAVALKILEDTAAGLAYAHAKGYIHRDIKPGNILFREDGTAIITDFGIAKLQDTSGELTRMGYTMGTVQYMSPEQAVTTDLDHRSDIYSLGLVFYEMLTGQKAFKAESTIQAIHQHTTIAPPELPPEYSFLQPTIDKVLAKEPGDRYQNISEFVDAIKSASEVDEAVMDRIPPQIEDDSTQILRAGHYQVSKNAEKNSKKGLFFGVASACVLLGGLAFGVIKYPEINSWFNNKEDTIKYISVSKSVNKDQALKEEIANKELEKQKNKLSLFEREKLKTEEENNKALAEKTELDGKAAEREKQQEIANAEQKKLEAEKREKDKILADQIAKAKKQAEEDSKTAELERKRIEAELNQRNRILAEQIALSKKQAIEVEKNKLQAEEDRKNAEVERKRIEAERNERNRILAQQIALSEKQAKEAEKNRIQAEEERKTAEVERKRIEAERNERNRLLAEQIALSEKQAKEAEKNRIQAELMEQGRIKKEKEDRELALKKSQYEELQKKTDQKQLAILEAERLQEEKLKSEQKEIARINAERDKLKAQREQDKIDLAIAEKNKLEAEQERLDAEVAAQRKQRADKLEKERQAKISEKKKADDQRKQRADKLKKERLAEKERQAKISKKKKADALIRQQQQANIRGQIRVSATLNGRPLNSTFTVTKNGKRIKAIGGKASANFVLPAGQYVVATQFSGKAARANVNLEPNDIITQVFAFRGSAPKAAAQGQKNWTHTH